MISKTLIQTILSILLILSLFLFYKTYFKDKNNFTSQTENLEKKIQEIKDQNNDEDNVNSNLIYNLSYNSSDIENNQYFINSESGIMSENGTEFMMNKVNAKIILNDDSEIIIFSDKAIYNNINYNTKFYGNVIAKYREQTIFSQNINLDFEIKLVTIYKDVLFQNLQTEIKTDKIEFDLMTKNILMFMDDKENKIKLKSSF
tara:strand:+ start:542 stop:1147 length:606 start_codon:yes stop_codon:yes gene_type:complete